MYPFCICDLYFKQLSLSEVQRPPANGGISVEQPAENFTRPLQALDFFYKNMHKPKKTPTFAIGF